MLDTVRSVRYSCLCSYHYLFSILMSIFINIHNIHYYTAYLVYFIHPVHEYRVLLFIL